MRDRWVGESEAKNDFFFFLSTHKTSALYRYSKETVLM